MMHLPTKEGAKALLEKHVQNEYQRYQVLMVATAMEGHAEIYEAANLIIPNNSLYQSTTPKYNTTLCPAFKTKHMSIEHKLEKPSPEAKALSLYLMAHKPTSSNHKEKSKRINKQWHRVLKNELSMEEYLTEVNTMLESYGGYSKVVEETVQHFIAKTGEWKLKGDGKYCADAQAVADKILGSGD